MIKAVNEISTDIIIDILETDSEVLFKFHSKYMQQLESILKPKTSGASTSPFSSKNLPKNKEYKVPDIELQKYKNIIQNVPQKDKLTIGHLTQLYLKSLANKRNKWEDIRADMIQKGLKGKEYIHSIGKWNEYLKYLSKNV